MQLKKFSYRDYNWEIQGLNLQIVNLFVGQNATGKSRTLYHIDLLVKILTQKRDITWGGQWIVEFETNSNDILIYELTTKASGEVSLEKLWKNNILKLERHRSSECRIFSESNNDWEKFTPPTNQLAILSRRDIRAFSYIEKIIEWANTSFGFRFGNLSPDNPEFDLLTAVEDIPVLFTELPNLSKEKIINQFKEIGFDVSKITASALANKTFLYVHEVGITNPFPHTKLSQGMMRSLCLLIFIEYLISRKNPATVIVDDLGEGLDYERAKALGKLVFDRCIEKSVQLIATTNDNFLMNVVDIDYWNVLMREGKTVKAINIINHPSIFEDFRFEGTSNFNFFSSSYLPSRL
jgi:AAA15 family ATPase/GTPase